MSVGGEIHHHQQRTNRPTSQADRAETQSAIRLELGLDTDEARDTHSVGAAPPATLEYIHSMAS